MYRTRLTTEPVQLIDCAYTWYYGHWYPLPPESLNVTLTRMLHTGDHTIKRADDSCLHGTRRKSVAHCAEPGDGRF